MALRNENCSWLGGCGLTAAQLDPLPESEKTIHLYHNNPANSPGQKILIITAYWLLSRAVAALP